jgi:hypothetical protein
MGWSRQTRGGGLWRVWRKDIYAAACPKRGAFLAHAEREKQRNGSGLVQSGLEMNSLRAAVHCSRAAFSPRKWPLDGSKEDLTSPLSFRVPLSSSLSPLTKSIPSQCTAHNLFAHTPLIGFANYILTRNACVCACPLPGWLKASS